uniref:Uncharacterized protein n=1 Tax=Pycnococcus provasolii TaxID=41880 RepID=A0A7S2YYN0_9CHLO|mmetsp:Transcript_3952/g.9896  ORF Transcript_3952/g.9896 Transcript_3952/m.9896 type:complete len:487 (+) Transcript_3952:65-1525(+)
MALLPTGLRAFSTWRSSLALVTSRASSSSASASSSSASSHAAALLASSPRQALLSDDDGNQQIKAPPSSPADNSSSLLLPKVMKWWKSRMPPAYLARVDPKAQERHARAVAVYAEQSENGNSSQLEETHVVSCIPDLTVFDPRDDTVTFIRGQDEPGVLISMLESLVHRAGERELVRADIFTSMDTALCANLLDYSPESVVSFDEANSTLDADELALATKVRGTEGSIASATPIKVRENGAPQAWKLRVAATNVVGDFALQRIAAYVGLFGLNIAEGRLVTLQVSEEVARSFWRARSALTCDLEQNSELKRGIVLSMRLHRAIIDQGGHAITKKQIRYIHSFRLMDLSGTSRGIGGAILSHPLALCRLAHFTMDALVQDGKRPKAMVVCTPSISFPSTANPSSSSSADGTGNILVVGTVREGGAYNRFSLAFGRAAERSGADVRTQGFEASWLEIPRSEFNSFLQALEAEQLQKATRRGGEATTAA